MSNKKQTPVEYLVEQLIPKALSEEQYYHIRKAKEMEKQQIIDAYNSGQQIPPFDYAEEYYTQTYGGQNNE
jgi:hypothetical protein